MAQTRKAQVVLSKRQFELLRAYADEQGKTLSAILRERLERTLLAELENREREAAVRRLAQLGLPTADWEVIERELELRWSECDRE